jgi:TfoX/Sxy family transcriptional regulator of competence genes
VAYDEALAERVRAAIGPVKELTEVKMFGGIGFLVNGNMACGVHGEDLIVRMDPDQGERLMARGGHARPMDITGRPMSGWLFVAPAGTKTTRSLETWVGRGVAFASALPPKSTKRKMS